MKALLLAAATVAFAAVMNLPPAVAAAANGNGSAWPGYLQATGSGPSGAATRAPHYEWQYHYAGRHPRWQGHWVLVR